MKIKMVKPPMPQPTYLIFDGYDMTLTFNDIFLFEKSCSLTIVTSTQALSLNHTPSTYIISL